MLFLLVLAAPAAVDEVELADGETIADCRVTDLGDSYKVVRKGVSTVIPKSKVKKVAYLETSEDIYGKRAAELKEEDLDGHLALARWCRERALTAQAQEQFEKVLAVDADHKEARAALGFQMVDGKWMTAEEVNRGKRLVRHKGRWMTPEERDLDLALQEARDLDNKIAAAVRKAVDNLGSSDEKRRQEAADRLSRFDNRYKVKPFLTALSARSTDARLFAVRELGGMKADLGNSAWTATKALARRAVWDESEEVRTEALTAIRTIDHPDTAVALAGYLGEESAVVRMRAENALGYFKDVRAVPGLIAVLSRTVDALRFIKQYEADLARIAKGVLITRDGRRIVVPANLHLSEEFFDRQGKQKLEDEKQSVLSALKAVTDQDFGEDPMEWQRWIERERPGK